MTVTLSKKDELSKLKPKVERLLLDAKGFGLSAKDIVAEISRQEHAQKQKLLQSNIPISVFSERQIGSFGLLVIYLIEVVGLAKSEIAQLLRRDPRTIWAAYDHARRRFSSPLDTSDSHITIPVNIFSQRKYSVLETLVDHLKDGHKLRNSQIAALLNRDEKTVWTVLHRHRCKR